MSPDNTSPHEELEERLRFETLIADLSSQFVNLPAGHVDREIMDAQRRLCELLGLDFSTLWQWSDEGPDSFTLTHFYSVQAGPQPPERMSQDQYPWARQQLLERNIVKVRSLDELPAEAARDRETLRQFGIKSNLALPLAVGGQPVIGLLGLGTTQVERDWPEPLVKRLQLLAQVFANALARKRADQALRESEERLSLAADSAEAGLWMLDYHTGLFWATNEARALFGFSPAEAISMERFKALVHPEDWTLVQGSLDRSVKAGERVNVEYRIQLGDGRTRWIASRGRPRFGPTGEPDRLMGLSVDITERKRTEAQVRQLSLAVEQSPVLVMITDLQGKIIYVNRKFTETTGYSAAECLGQNPRLFKSGECPPATYQELWTCITGGRIWRGEFHNRKKSGELYWERAVISPLLDAAGHVTHFVGVKEDVTERKRTEAALRASETRLAAGTELAGLGYYEVDYGERTCFLDDRFREICGVPPGLQGFQSLEFWMEHVHPDDRQFLLDQRQKLHDGGLDRISAEYRYLHPAQGQKWLHHLARIAAHSPTGPGVRTFGVVRDITQQKRAELEAHELRNNLTHLTRVNTLGALSGSLAHELNQPLGIILSNAQAAQELLAQEPPDLAEVQAILTDIVAADRRAGDVIGRLRSLLKRGLVSLQPLALNPVIEEVLQLTQADLIGRGVTVVRELVPDLPPITGDRIQLQQLVLNLILNAADAMAANSPGERRLHLQTQFHHGRVRASVRDEGTGLPADPESLFQPFYTTKTHGLGLGLSICRSIAAAHHGQLWAEPHPARGAVFHFELPAASGEGQVAVQNSPSFLRHPLPATSH